MCRVSRAARSGFPEKAKERQAKRKERGANSRFSSSFSPFHPLSQQSVNVARVRFIRKVLLEVKSTFKVATDVQRNHTSFFFLDVFKGNRTNFGSIDISIDLPDKLIYIN